VYLSKEKNNVHQPSTGTKQGVDEGHNKEETVKMSAKGFHGNRLLIDGKEPLL
jgi:hypothetical protein